MTYRLPGERVTLDTDGDVTVEPIRSWVIQHLGLRRYGAFQSAAAGDAEAVALNAMGEYLMAEAQPAWDITDHRGAIPATASGYLRLPLALQQGIYLGWLETLIVPQEEHASAVDALVPPGKFRTAIKRELRSVKKAA